MIISNKGYKAKAMQLLYDSIIPFQKHCLMRQDMAKSMCDFLHVVATLATFSHSIHFNFFYISKVHVGVNLVPGEFFFIIISGRVLILNIFEQSGHCQCFILFIPKMWQLKPNSVVKSRQVKHFGRGLYYS